MCTFCADWWYPTLCIHYLTLINRLCFKIIHCLVIGRVASLYLYIMPFDALRISAGPMWTPFLFLLLIWTGPLQRKWQDRFCAEQKVEERWVQVSTMKLDTVNLGLLVPIFVPDNHCDSSMPSILNFYWQIYWIMFF